MVATHGARGPARASLWTAAVLVLLGACGDDGATEGGDTGTPSAGTDGTATTADDGGTAGTSSGGTGGTATDGSSATGGSPTGGGTSSTGNDSTQATTTGTGETSGVTTTSSGPSDGGSTGVPDIDPDAWNAPITWYPCPWTTGGASMDAECADVEVPLDWTDQAGATIEVFIKRAGAVISGTRQVWLLQGGPGGASNGMEGFGSSLMGVDAELAVYLIDHRGTGRSARLGCPDQEAPGSPGGLEVVDAEWSDCIAALQTIHGDDLAHYRTTYAAADLGWLARQLAGAQDLHVFGGSYGTYWAHRYLQLFPDDATGVSMFGIAAPSFDFAKYDERFNDQAEALLDLCDADAVCGTKLGPNAATRAHAILDMLEAGHCAASGLQRSDVTRYFGSLLAFGYDSRALIPAVLYRIERCDPADVVALQTAAPQMSNPLGGLLSDPLFSVPLGNHISLSEMWQAGAPTEAQAQTEVDDAIASLGSTLRRTKVVDEWPTYMRDWYVDRFAQTDTPMLMLEGDYDPNSPPVQADVMGTMFTATWQRYVKMPYGSHALNYPMMNGGECGTSMIAAFIQNPTDLIPDCRPQIRPIDWATAGGAAPGFFGTTDLWENP